jgi:hypothetical protein
MTPEELYSDKYSGMRTPVTVLSAAADALPPALKATRTILVLVTVVCSMVQLIWGEAEDSSVLLAACGALLTLYALRPVSLSATPQSSLMLVGYGFSYFFLPLAVMTLEGKALTFGLLKPELTFGFSLLVFACLILAHGIYTASPLPQGIRAAITNKLLIPIGVFSTPQPGQLFAIGAIGLGSMLVVSLGFEAKHSGETGNIIVKALEGLFPLAYAPYLAVLYPLMGKPASSLRRLAMPLFVFSCAVLVAGAARNSRTALLVGVASITVGVVLGGWLGVLPSHWFRARNILLSLLLIAIIAPGITRLATAMVAVRMEHWDASPTDYLQFTLSAFLNRATLDSSASELDRSARLYSWDEYNIDSPLLARLSSPMSVDNSLAVVSELDSSGRTEVAERERVLALTILPQPILSALSITLDKEAERGSMGSFLYYLMTSDPRVFGGFRTGSFIASAWACFGWLFPFVICGIAIMMFIVFDSYADRTSSGMPCVIAPVALLSLYSTMVLFTSAASGTESLSEFVRIVVRDIPQTTILYLCVAAVVRRVVKS